MFTIFFPFPETILSGSDIPDKEDPFPVELIQQDPDNDKTKQNPSFACLHQTAGNCVRLSLQNQTIRFSLAFPTMLSGMRTRSFHL